MGCIKRASKTVSAHLAAVVVVAWGWMAWTGALAVAQEPPPVPPPDSPESASQTFLLTGQIVDAFNERPVIAAVVKVPDLKLHVFTDVEGRFSFPDFPAGTWDIVVEQLGYHTTEGPATVSEGNGLFIRLTPDPIALEGFRVRSRSEQLLTTRRRSIPYRVVTLDARTFAQAVNPDPTVVLKRYSGAPIVPCPGDDGSLIFGCVLRKGRPGNIGVFLDEGPLPGGMESLSIFPLENIHSMDFILTPSGGMLRVYTKWFVDKLDQTRISLTPLVW